MYIQILDLVIYYSNSIFSDDPAYGENKNSRMVNYNFFIASFPDFSLFVVKILDQSPGIHYSKGRLIYSKIVTVFS